MSSWRDCSSLTRGLYLGFSHVRVSISLWPTRTFEGTSSAPLILVPITPSTLMSVPSAHLLRPQPCQTLRSRTAGVTFLDTSVHEAPASPRGLGEHVPAPRCVTLGHLGSRAAPASPGSEGSSREQTGVRGSQLENLSPGKAPSSQFPALSKGALTLLPPCKASMRVALGDATRSRCSPPAQPPERNPTLALKSHHCSARATADD